MADKIVNYKCPNCTGPLHFDSESGKLKCDFCGSSFRVSEIEAIYAKKAQKAANALNESEGNNEGGEQEKASGASGSGSKAAGSADEAAGQQGNVSKQGSRTRTGDSKKDKGDGWDYSGMSDDWGEDEARLRTYNCPSCGAELVCEETTGATSCPYCGNPTIVPGKFSGMLRPDYIIPFKLDKDAAVAALKKHYHGKHFLPKTFTSDNHVQNIQGIYVPFWLYDGRAEGWANYEGTRSRVTRTSDEVITTTSHFDIYREGNVSFEKVPVDGSKKMDDDFMDSIEPYDYNELQKFSMAYLPGYLADKYDESAQDCAPRADRRCEQTLLDELYGTVTGYETVTLKSKSLSLRRGKVHYALLPVWVLNTKWQNKDFMFMMNGQTGKMVGDLPVSKGKYWGTFAVIAGVIMAVLSLAFLR